MAVISSCPRAKLYVTEVRRSSDGDSQFSDMFATGVAVLVLATGSKWTGPIDFPDSDADIHQFTSQWQQRFKSAEDVVIVGGGSVGIGA